MGISQEIMKWDKFHRIYIIIETKRLYMRWPKLLSMPETPGT